MVPYVRYWYGIISRSKLRERDKSLRVFSNLSWTLFFPPVESRTHPTFLFLFFLLTNTVLDDWIGLGWIGM